MLPHTHENLLRALFDSTYQFIGLLELDGTLIDANQTALDFGGLTRDDVIGRPFWECAWWLISPETQEQLRAAIARAAQGEFIRYEVEVLGRGGTTAIIDFSIKPVYDTAGRITHLVPEGRNISERRRAEAARRESEQLLTGILASSLDGIVALRSVRDAAGRIADFEWLLVNPRAETLLGRSADELLGRRLLETLPGNRETGLFDSYVRVVETGLPADHEFRYDADGIHGWFRNTCVKLGDGFALTFRDITTQKQSEELRLTLAAGQMGTWDIDLASREVLRSAGTDRLFGFTSEAVRRTLDEFVARVHPDDVAAVEQAIELTRTQGIEHYVEYRVLHDDGSLRWVMSRGGAIFSTDGSIERLAGVVFDITERRQAEEALRRSEEHFRRAVLNAPFPIIIHGEDGLVRQISLAWTGISGYTLDDIPTVADWTSRAYGERNGRVRDVIARLYQLDGAAHDGEFAIRTSQGDQRIWDFSSAPLGLDEQGQQLVISMAVDVTERKRAEEAERDARREAEEALQLRDQFLTVASHELKTPLTALLGNAELLTRRLQRSGSLPEREARVLQAIVEQGRRLGRLVATMLDVSRFQSGLLPFELSRCDLRELVRRVVSERHAQFGSHHLALSLDPQPVIVQCDVLRIEQVLDNLLQNAAKYSEPGSSIRLDLVRADGDALLTVADKGIGIPADALPHVFTRFYRAPNVDAQRGSSGMGVGLYVVHEVVTRHGGTVEVTSVEGGGSTFTVRLPLVAAEDSP